MAPLRRLLAPYLLLTLAACDAPSPPPPPQAPAEPVEVTAPNPELAEATAQTWSQAVDLINTTLSEAETLRSAGQTLLADPTAANLGAVHLAWHRAHDSYARFAPFAALATSNPGLFGQLEALTFAIDAEPIQPGFIDYFDVYPQSGIVNDIAMPLSADALRQQHGLTDPSDVALGFHALEYLLFGEDGTRPATDFVAVNELSTEQRRAGMSVVELAANRRRTYLMLGLELLLDDLVALQQQLAESNAPLRQTYLNLPGPTRLRALQDAAAAYLQGAYEDLATSASEDQVEDAEPVQALHNAFAGANASLLGEALTTIETSILSNESGLGEWVSTESDTGITERVSRWRQSLLTWNDKAWPPKGEQQTELLTLIDDLLTLFIPNAPRTLSDPNSASESSSL